MAAVTAGLQENAKRCARNVQRFILKINRKTNNSSYEESNSSYDV